MHPPDVTLLTTAQMAHFAARGFLRFDAVVPEAVNRAFLEQVGDVPESEVDSVMAHYGKVMRSAAVPVVAAGTALDDAYGQGTPLRALVDLPVVRGAIESLVGPGSRLDHHFLHITFPPRFYLRREQVPKAQHWHQDSTIDPRRAFDIQLLYFPHAVTAAMGGTRFLPGSHLRIVSEAAIARYQNIRGQQHVVCPAGTLLIVHHGIWHGGGMNVSEQLRYMFKIRLAPSRRQERLWDTSDLPATREPQRPIFWTGSRTDENSIAAVLTRPEPWFEADTMRLEYINRARFWRQLSADPHFDADYWLTRIENEPA
ncbi:MAG: phytanoyl-CoA dioxygenase family protein [Gammaproteobacteria bacterium]|nr:phytanoyl-CoA dioxygenase family protein [Gammaproteobacteria bacterium]